MAELPILSPGCVPPCEGSEDHSRALQSAFRATAIVRGKAVARSIDTPKKGRNIKITIPARVLAGLRLQRAFIATEHDISPMHSRHQ